MTTITTPTPVRFIVFDLDDTVWDFMSYSEGDYIPISEIHNHVHPIVLDYIRDISLNPRIVLGIASRSRVPYRCRAYLRELGILDLFSYVSIHYCAEVNKSTHFHALAHLSKIPFTQMTLIDDEQKNLDSVRDLGVHGILFPPSHKKRLSTED